MRRRLIGLVAASTTMVALAFLLPLLVQTVDGARDRAVRPAELEVRSVAPAVALTNEATLQRLVAAASSEARPLGVLRPDGSTIGAPPPAAVVAVAADLTRTGTVATEDGVAVVAPVVRGDGTWVVHASVAAEDLTAGVVPAVALLVGLAVALVFGAVLVARQLAGRTLDAVAELERTAERLGQGDLTARADVDDPPEFVSVGRTLERLAGRIEDLRAAERAAAADLSHRLRTPLTPLRIDAAALADTAERERIEEHVAALERAVSHVIRAMSSGSADGEETTDLSAVTRERVAFWSALAEDEQRPVVADVTDRPAQVALSTPAAADLLDVLLDNVFTHTPDGTRVSVDLQVDRDDVTLVVADQGPGFDAAAARRGASSRPDGTGLGLDIARRMALHGGGTLEVASSDDGTRVTVALPLVVAAN